jgi:hypothetical protein
VIDLADSPDPARLDPCAATMARFRANEASEQARMEARMDAERAERERAEREAVPPDHEQEHHDQRAGEAERSSIHSRWTVFGR